MPKGTIVYIGGMEMPSGNAAAQRARANAKIFKELGYKVAFVGVDKEIKEDCYEPKEIGEFLSFPSKYPKSAIEWIKALIDFKHIKFVLDRFQDLKIVVAYNMHLIPLKKVIRYCKKRGVKVVVDSTEWYENKFSLSPIKFVKWYDTKRCMTSAQKKADGMIAISKYLFDYYKPFVKNIIELPPLVDIEDGIWSQEVKREEKIQFVYAGQPGRDKDRLDLVVDAFCEIKSSDFAFNVVGTTEDEFLKDYGEKRGELERLGKRIKFFGRLSHEESIKSLLSSDYCIFIRDRSRKNTAGFPTKFAECVTSGVGIIASDVSNIKDYFPLKSSCLLKDTDKESIVSAIKSGIERGKVEHSLSSTFDYRNYVEDVKAFLERI